MLEGMARYAQIRFALAALCVPACSPEQGAEPPASASPAPRWCDVVPREANSAFDSVNVATDWFDVYRVEDGVFALVEAKQFQEAISYLIVGTKRALLFDTGMGLVPIRPVVEELTALPVEVLNSHTHFDHVGGNAEFDAILAMDLPYTRANQRGFGHEELASEVADDSFCGAPPPELDPETYHTRAWKPTRSVTDGETIDLGGRVLEILHLPGHTPDSLALLDRAHGLLWTGDTYYEGPIWLYVPETDLDAYERSVARLRALAPSLRRLLPAHNTVSADPVRLTQVANAIRRVRSGSLEGVEQSDNRVVFPFPGFAILTSKPLLRGEHGDPTRGGSGLTTWP